MFKGLHLLEPGSIQKDLLLGQYFVDTIQPLLQISAAALEYESFLIFHTAQLVSRSFLNIRYMVCHCCSSWTSSWDSFRKLSNSGTTASVLPLSQVI